MLTALFLTSASAIGVCSLVMSSIYVQHLLSISIPKKYEAENPCFGGEGD
jgi:hypothetical protein